jgi:regulator of sigma E protease
MALVDAAMAGGEVRIQVRDMDDRLRSLTLNLHAVQDEAEQGRLLDAVGLSLWRPRLPPVIERVLPGGAAERAGLAAGDRILGVDDQPVEDWQQWAAYVRAHPGSSIAVRIERDGERLTLKVIPEALETKNGLAGQVGAAAQVPEGFSETFQIMVRYNLPQAAWEAVAKTWHMSLFTLRMLGRILIGKASLENISGPIAIAQFAGQSASIGIIPFLSFLALVSISLGVLNLLPIPVLDGGHLLYYFIEVVKGSPISESVQQLGQRFGLVLLLMLMSLALFNDLARLL